MNKSTPKLRIVAVVEVVADRASNRVRSGVRGPEDVAALIGKMLRKSDREKFVCIHLNSRHESIGVEVVSVGSLNASIVHPREVFKGALLANAASIIVAHNHPSGDPEPSEEDLSITKRLVAAGDLLGVGVLDHVIIAGTKVVSFRSRNLL